MHALEIRKDYYHAVDFVVYAHLQLGQDAKAKAMLEQAREVDGKPAQRDRVRCWFPNGDGGDAGAPRARARRLERRRRAADHPAGSPVADSLTRFTRGLGMARTGDLAGAKAEIEAMQELRATLEKSDNWYWADRTEEQMLAVSAWIALAEGNKEQAEKFMRAAADREDGSVKHVAMENRLYPMRELYAELLLEMGQAAPALREFETALKAYPNRYRSIYGIARAAEAGGDRRKAADHYEKLMALAKNADSTRPELARARTFVVQR